MMMAPPISPLPPGVLPPRKPVKNQLSRRASVVMPEHARSGENHPMEVPESKVKAEKPDVSPALKAVVAPISGMLAGALEISTLWPTEWAKTQQQLHKADPNIGNENNDLPTHLAALARQMACLKVLLDPGINPAKVNIDAHDAQGYCALHYACGEGHLEVARALLQVAAHERALSPPRRKSVRFGYPQVPPPAFPSWRSTRAPTRRSRARIAYRPLD